MARKKGLPPARDRTAEFLAAIARVLTDPGTRRLDVLTPPLGDGAHVASIYRLHGRTVRIDIDTNVVLAEGEPPNEKDTRK